MTRRLVVLLFLALSACTASSQDDTQQPSPPTGAVATSLPLPSDAARGSEYYVAVDEPGASDDNNGRFATFQGGRDGPWLTIQHAADEMTAGDIAHIRGGTYYEAGIRFTNEGQSGAPIILANYEGESVIIDGSEARRRSSGIEIVGGQSHYLIRGLTLRNMPSSGITTLNAPQVYQDITIQDCILHDNGLSGIRLVAVDGFLVENVEAYSNDNYGMNIIATDNGMLSPANGVVRNSSFHDHIGREGHGLAINQGHDIVVSDNVAYHNRIHGFDVTDWPKRGEVSHDITIERNFSYDNGKVGFSINSDSHHVIYRNNVAWRNGADWAFPYTQPGFMCYGGCWHVEWYNNVSIANTGAGFWITDELGANSTTDPEDNLLIFKNNIAYDNGRLDWNARPALVVQGNETWEVIAAHNNWGGAPGPVVGINVRAKEPPYLFEDEENTYTTDEINGGNLQEGNISVNPQFVDPALPDVHLQSGSPCIDAGIDVGLLYQGAAPDMGAYEFEIP